MKNTPSLQDENVRKAIFLAIDKELLVQAAYGGYGTASHSSVTGQSSPYYILSLKPMPKMWRPLSS